MACLQVVNPMKMKTFRSTEPSARFWGEETDGDSVGAAALRLYGFAQAILWPWKAPIINASVPC